MHGKALKSSMARSDSHPFQSSAEILPDFMALVIVGTRFPSSPPHFALSFMGLRSLFHVLILVGFRKVTCQEGAGQFSLYSLRKATLSPLKNREESSIRSGTEETGTASPEAL